MIVIAANEFVGVQDVALQTKAEGSAEDRQR
jgi:hypothetical protein